MSRLLILFFLWFVALPWSVRAQTVDVVVDSPWGMWATDVTVTLAAAPLRRNATTGTLEAIAGHRVAIGRVAFLQPLLTVTFPGQTSTAMTVAGLRLYHKANGAGWVMPEHPVNVTLPVPLVVPAGRKLVCRYDMPIAMKGKVTCSVVSLN